MEKIIFENAVEELFHFFRYREPPDQNVLDLWFRKVRLIPKEALEWIVENLEEAETLPRNLPRTFRGLWQVYKKQFPDKILRTAEACPDCSSRGYLSFSKHEPDYGYRYIYIARCGSCPNHLNVFGSDAKMATLTAAQIKNMDWDPLLNDSPIISGSRCDRGVVKNVADKALKGFQKEMSQSEKVQEAQRQKQALQDEIPF